MWSDWVHILRAPRLFGCALVFGVLSWGVGSVEAGGPKLLLAGQKAMDGGDYEKAISLLRRAAKELPHWGIVHLELARALQFNGSGVKKVRGPLFRALKLLPSNPRVHIQAALFWESQTKEDKALSHYEKAIKLGYSGENVCLRATRLWMARKRGKKAVSCLRSLLRRRKSPAQVHFFLARIYEGQKKLSTASGHIRSALSFRPTWLPLLRYAFLFYNRHYEAQPRDVRWDWKRYLLSLRKRLKVLIPQQPRRRLRPLLPSRDRRR